MIRPDDIFDAIGTLDEETVFNAKAMKGMKKMKKHRISYKRGLIAAAIMALCCISVSAAYYITHQKTVDLMETGVQTGGAVPVEVDDAAISTIEEKSVDYNTAVTDNGTTVTLDSIMGCTSEDYTICYLTLTIAPPEGTVLTSDMQECGFMSAFLQAEDDTIATGGSGTTTAIDNGDGTYSALLMWQFYGTDIGNIPMKLELSGFGNVSKEVASELYSGNREIEIPGSWVFHFDTLPLEKTSTLEFDASLFADEKIHPSKIELSSFGVLVTYTAESVDVVENLGMYLSEKYPELNMDWDHMDLEQLNFLCAEGATFTDEQQEDIEVFLADYGGMNGDELKAQLTDYQLRYQDGSICKIGSEFPDWVGLNNQGENVALICFDAPVAVEKLAYFEIGNIRIPITQS